MLSSSLWITLRLLLFSLLDILLRVLLCLVPCSVHTCCVCLIECFVLLLFGCSLVYTYDLKSILGVPLRQDLYGYPLTALDYDICQWKFNLIKANLDLLRMTLLFILTFRNCTASDPWLGLFGHYTFIDLDFFGMKNCLWIVLVDYD